MNKLEKIKTYFKNKEITRQINNYETNEKIKEKIIKAFKEEGYKEEEIIKNLKEEEDSFILGNNVFSKNKNPKITISNLIIKSNKVIFDKCEINLTSIKEINEKEFKTGYATYYIGGFKND